MYMTDLLFIGTFLGYLLKETPFFAAAKTVFDFPVRTILKP